MEHRWGERVGVDVPVKVVAHPFSVRACRLTNLSVSGAFIRADFELRVLSRIQVAIELPQRARHDAPIIPAYVTRKFKDGIGIEWCEFAPPAISHYLQLFSSRRYVRLRKAEAATVAAIARLSPPLLKHGM